MINFEQVLRCYIEHVQLMEGTDFIDQFPEDTLLPEEMEWMKKTSKEMWDINYG